MLFLAMLAALVAAASSWLEMRVNLGYIFFGSWLALPLAARFFQKFPGPATTLLSLVLAAGAGVLLDDVKPFKVMLAAFIREGLHMNFLNFTAINAGMIVFIDAGLLAV